MRTPLAYVMALALGLGACADKKATQVVISLATDLKAGDPLRKLDMKIERFDPEHNDYVPAAEDLTTNWEIGQPPVAYELPGSVVTYSGDGSEQKLRVTLQAFKPSAEAMLRRQVIFKLVKEKTLYIRLGITDKCFANADCPATKTCIEGRCKDIEFKNLPIYDESKRPEFSVQCNSGTTFINTTTGAALAVGADQKCSINEVCIEGTCYPKNVFGDDLIPAPQTLTLNVMVTDQVGTPVPGVQLRPEDGPVSLVRKLRDAEYVDRAVTPPVSGSNPYVVQMQADPLTTELRLTVSVPGTPAMFAPQVVTIPVKRGVTRYNVPVVLLRMEERAIGGPITLSGGGRTATLQLPGTATGMIRYALMDGRYLPGQAVVSTAGGLLQSVAVLYLEYVNRSSFPMGTTLTLGRSSTPFVFGAGSAAGAFVLGLQGQWNQPMGAALLDEMGAPRLTATSDKGLPGGFWTIANHTGQPGCVRGRLIRPGNVPCAGVQVRLLGPDGVSSSDFTDVDGNFCAPAAQREAAILAVGTNTSTIYIPPSAAAASCSATGCVDLGDRLVGDTDCMATPSLAAARKAVTESCNNTLECAGLASCYHDTCVSESFVRVSMNWGVQSDFDLYLKLPDGKVIGTENALDVIPGIGRLDVQQCTNISQCATGTHVESIVLSAAAPPGSYEVWVHNFGAQLASTANLEVNVAGQRRTERTVMVPATPPGMSEPLTFTLP